MSATVELNEGKITTALDVADLSLLVLRELKVVKRCLRETLLSWPFKSFGPGFVAEPVADDCNT